MLCYVCGRGLWRGLVRSGGSITACRSAMSADAHRLSEFLLESFWPHHAGTQCERLTTRCHQPPTLSGLTCSRSTTQPLESDCWIGRRSNGHAVCPGPTMRNHRKPTTSRSLQPITRPGGGGLRLIALAVPHRRARRGGANAAAIWTVCSLLTSRPTFEGLPQANIASDVSARRRSFARCLTSACIEALLVVCRS